MPTPTKKAAPRRKPAPNKDRANLKAVIEELDRILRSGNSGNEKVAILQANVKAWQVEFKV